MCPLPDPVAIARMSHSNYAGTVCRPTVRPEQPVGVGIASGMVVMALEHHQTKRTTDGALATS